MYDSYQQARWGRRYGYRDPIYAKGYHRGMDLRRQNAAGTASVVADVHALTAGTVVYVGRPNASLELTVVIDTGRARGRYESHSHMAGVTVNVGAKVKADQRIGRNARLNERPGLVNGVHDHMTITDYRDGAWNTARPEYDPLPFIRDALAAAAGGNPTPLPPAPPVPPPPKRKRRKMSVGVIYDKASSDRDRRGAIVDTSTGLVSRFGWFSAAYADKLAAGFGLEQAAPVTPGQYDAILADMRALAEHRLTGTVSVLVEDER